MLVKLCLAIFNLVFQCLQLLTYNHHCFLAFTLLTNLLVHVYPCYSRLPLCTVVYQSLPLFACECLPMFTDINFARVYLCLHLFTYVYPCSLVFTYIYQTLLVHVYLCLLIITRVYICLHLFTYVYHYYSCLSMLLVHLYLSSLCLLVLT